MSFTPAETVAACTECGKIHHDDSPPCDRCGAMGFRPLNPDDLDDGADEVESVEASTFTRRQLLYSAGAAAVVLAGGYAFLSSDDTETDTPGQPDETTTNNAASEQTDEPTTRESYPTNEAPGQPEEASGIRFATVETELRGLINDERENEDAGTLTTAENVDAFATYYNKEYVKAGGTFDGSPGEEFASEFNVSDYHVVGNHIGDGYDGRAIDTYSSPSEVARACFDSWMAEDQFRDPFTDPQYQRIGLDVHVDETGDVFLLAVLD